MRVEEVDSDPIFSLPFGDVRKLWVPAALEKLQPEIDRAEQWARETGLVHCENLIKRLAPGGNRL